MRQQFIDGLAALDAGELRSARRAFVAVASAQNPFRSRARRLLTAMDRLSAAPKAIASDTFRRLVHAERARLVDASAPGADAPSMSILPITPITPIKPISPIGPIMPIVPIMPIEPISPIRPEDKDDGVEYPAPAPTAAPSSRSLRRPAAKKSSGAPAGQMSARPPRPQGKGDRGDRTAPPRRSLRTHPAATRSRATTAETPRFTDAAVLEGHLFPSDDLAAARRVPDSHALVAGQPYTLEVAIRAKRCGIQKARTSPRQVANPRKGIERLTIYVLAKSVGASISIKEPFAKIDWPFDADSSPALFRLRVSPLPGEVPGTCSIAVSLYDANLDLLDVVQVTLPVVADGGRLKGARIGRATLSWPDHEPAAVRPDPDGPRRDLTIVVRSIDDGFEFDYLMRRPRGIVKVSVTRRITAQDLETLLKKVRDFWTDLVITTYAEKLTVTKGRFSVYLEALQALGVEAWALLFGWRTADLAGAAEAAGALLAATEMVEEASVQIDCAAAEDFIFPWAILYPPIAGRPPVEPLKFWGARYKIEQVTRGPRLDRLTDDPVKVLFALDPAFGNSDEQRAMFEQYHLASGGRLDVTPPVTDERSLVSGMISDPSVHLLYFYSHGYAASGGRFLSRDGVQRLRDAISRVADGSAERAALETLLQLTARMGDESWIQIGDSQITENELKLEPFFIGRRPIVFLNMCQSADLLPSMSSGLVRLFLDHNASAVLGTESPMTAVFAHAFARAVFDALLANDDIGTALWKARRHFLSPERRNPLGLAYTLYGRGVARLGSRTLVSSTAMPSPDPSAESRLPA